MTTALQRRHLLVGLALLPLTRLAGAQTFDHSHAAWTALLKKHVLVLRGGQASQVRYGGMAADRAALKAYLDTLSGVGTAAFTAWTNPQQMAFLINAYNANTVELILTKWPKLTSIKDIGTFIESPWKPKWITLLGNKVSLDDIEHQMLRARGRYDDPRVHFAVNCASIGCPALREEAFDADRLDAQLDEQTLRFMSDRSRNRYDPAGVKLEVSKIFDWFGDDFKQGFKGITALPVFLAKFANVLADAPADREKVRAGGVGVSFLEYDWKLNGAPG